MKVGMKKTVEVEAKVLRMSVKCSDRFYCTITDQDGEQLIQYDGYVPSFFPGGDGDYVELDIDIDTGKILNWKPSAAKIAEFLNGEEEE